MPVRQSDRDGAPLACLERVVASIVFQALLYLLYFIRLQVATARVSQSNNERTNKQTHIQTNKHTFKHSVSTESSNQPTHHQSMQQERYNKQTNTTCPYGVQTGSIIILLEIGHTIP
jgi:hypothetical protein